MSARKMHEGEVDIDAALVRELVAAQFPQWAALSIDEVRSTGTVNAIYRLGDATYVRLPRIERWARDLEKELRWLPVLAAQLPLAVPEPVATGAPGLGYPFSWAIYRWLAGDTFSRERIDDECRAAEALAQFVATLRCIDPSGAPRSSRDRPLPEKDAATRAAIASSRGAIDTDAVIAAWNASLRAPVWEGNPVWVHGDLLPPNLLVRNGRLRAVIDFGSVGVGDPAVDVIPAWSVFGTDGRAAFRAALDVDDATWARGRGLALHQALLIIPYYSKTNPAFVTMAVRTLDQVLADSAA